MGNDIDLNKSAQTISKFVYENEDIDGMKVSYPKIYAHAISKLINKVQDLGNKSMKRYLVFIGDNYKPHGGMGDFKKDFNSLERAIEYANEEICSDSWCHIYDQHEEKKVFSI